MAIVKKITQRSMQAAETKSTLFKTALDLFKEHGYDTVTIEDITKAAGVSKGTFYLYFESKDSVLVEQFRLIDDHYKTVFDSVPKSMPADMQLYTLVQAMCEYCADVCGLNPIRIVYINQISGNSKANILGDRDRYLYILLNQIVEAGIQQDIFRSDLGTDRLVTLIARSFHALIYDWCLPEVPFDLKKEGKEYCAIMLRMLIK